MSAAGALDTTFNGVGYVTTDLLGYDDEVHALVIQSDGKIVVGGSAGKNGSGASGFGLTRYTTGGALDTTYSGDGIVTDHRGFESHLLRFYILESFFAASVPSMALPRHNPRGALSLLLMLLLAVTGCDAAETTAADDGASDEAAAIEHLSKIITWQSDVLAHHSDPFSGRIHTDYLTAYRQAMEVDGLDYVHESPLAIRAEIVPSGYDGLPFLRATFVGSDASRPVSADLATPRSDGEPEYLLGITLNADDEVVRRTLRRVSYSTIFLTYLDAGRATATDMREVAEEGFPVRYLDPRHFGENLYIRFRCIDGKQTRWAPVADRRGEASGPESGA